MAKRYESDRTNKDKVELEKQKLSQMNLKEKLDYIWTYYKLLIFGIIGAIAMIVFIVNQVERSKYHNILGIAVANADSMLATDSVENELLGVLGNEDDPYQQIHIDMSFPFGGDMQQADYNTLMKFAAVVAAKEIDILLCNEEVYKFYEDQEFFMDLSTLLSEEECAAYGISKGDIAMEISGLSRYQAMNLTYYKPVYLVVMVNAPNPDKAREFINYIEEAN